MARDFCLELRFVGVFPQKGHREYRFNIEKENTDIRQVIVTIADGLFMPNRLTYQEAPDLCYQKLLADLRIESKEAPIYLRTAVTATDIDSYRETRQTARAGRHAAGSRNPVSPGYMRPWRSY
jgi:hypothetical protein